jgi:uracil phosphoribosyltransferase
VPSDIAQRRVLLLDAVLASGSSVLAALRRLTQPPHSVPIGNITLVTLIATEHGLANVLGAYAQLQVVTSFLDPTMSVDLHMSLPGVGHFGGRYFGTDAGKDDDDGLSGSETYFVRDGAAGSR